MQAFEAIDLRALVTVTGGTDQDPPNTSESKSSGNIGLTAKEVQLGIQGSYETKTSKTNPAQCAADVRAAGGSASDVLRCYGVPSK